MFKAPGPSPPLALGGVNGSSGFSLSGIVNFCASSRELRVNSLRLRRALFCSFLLSRNYLHLQDVSAMGALVIIARKRREFVAGGGGSGAEDSRPQGLKPVKSG